MLTWRLLVPYLPSAERTDVPDSTVILPKENDGVRHSATPGTRRAGRTARGGVFRPPGVQAGAPDGRAPPGRAGRGARARRADGAGAPEGRPALDRRTIRGTISLLRLINMCA
ncbi:hypothetical protein KNE206_15830 [Kitasatospora sp. NE20-6]